MLHRFALLLSCLLSLTIPLAAQTFHAVLVAATADPVLSTACEEDMARMTGNFRQIATVLNYPLNLITVSREQFNRAGVDQAIGRVQCAPGDVVFFYYTGHGYNMTTRTSQYPILQLESDPARNISLDDVHAQLKQKGPRLCVSLGDCCNKVFAGKPTINRNVPRGLTLSAEIVKKLFTVPQGDVLIASSERNQVSGAYVTGSFYTLGFDQALNHALYYNQQIDWKQLLTDTQGCMESLEAARQNGQKSIFTTNLNDISPGPAPTSTPAETVAAPTPQPTVSPDVFPVVPAEHTLSPATTAPTGPNYAEVNQLLNQLADESLSITQRRQLRGQVMGYFIKNARVRLYQNETEVALQPIETALSRLFINADKIQRVNVIERRSAPTPDRRQYEVIGWQEEWTKAPGER